MFDVFDTAEKMENFRSAENDRQLLGLPGSRDARFQVPASLEGNIVEEAKGGSGDDDRTRSQLALVRQVQLIVTYFFRTQQFRRLTKMAGEQGDMQNIRSLGVRRQVPHLHVLDHALPKEGHRKLLCEVEWAAHAATPGSRKTEPLRDPNTQPRSVTMPLLAVFSLMLLPTAKRFSPMEFIRH